MAILVTGCAGFIGFSITMNLLNHNIKVLGVDNLNDYYSIKLKKERLKELKKNKNFKYFKKDCSDKNFKNFFLKDRNISQVIHLAAEVGVRNSYSKPDIYFRSNIEGFFNILEICRATKSNLIFASSSSVYGNSKRKFFQESNETSKPISFYAATKKSNEIMAYAYVKNYNFSAIGIRFFNVYGPWGRPDMSIYKFTNLMMANKKIPLYGTGKQLRDFTYIDDVINLINSIIKKYKYKKQSFEVFNSGKGQCINIINLIKLLSKKVKIKPIIQKKQKQIGDVNFTNSSSKKIYELLRIKPKIDLDTGINKFLDWYYLIGRKIK
jgi:UDP-glucuronate 4-epimerase